VSPVTLLAAERIKLTSTRSPWWSALAAIVSTIGIGLLMAATTASDERLTVAGTQSAYLVGMAVVMVMATLAVTTEYAVGTIRTTFLAAPSRSAVLAAKAVVVAVVAALIGLLSAFGSWAASAVLLTEQDVALRVLTEWRQVAGVGLVYAGAALIGVAVGLLVRHTAGAVALVLVWGLAAETLITALPGVGPALSPFLPFEAARRFLGGEAPADAALLESPWISGAWFGAVAVALLAVAIAVTRRRDA
jgi:ABC-2 type transport system permease protein